MQLTAEYLRDQAIQLEHALSNRGMTSPDVEIRLNWTAYTEARIVMSYHAQSSYKLQTFSAETIADLPAALDAAWTHVRDLPSAEELRRRDFLKSLSDLIAEGSELGLPVDFLNPLEESMRKLSENILEHRTGGAD